jgi:hypothetical protein
LGIFESGFFYPQIPVSGYRSFLQTCIQRIVVYNCLSVNPASLFFRAANIMAVGVGILFGKIIQTIALETSGTFQLPLTTDRPRA